MFKIKFIYLSIMLVGTSNNIFAESELDRIIPPEIKNDAFYEAIYRYAKTEPVSTVLEIGSSSGDGSTEAFVLGIKENPNKPTLFCMEISKPRFALLNQRYGHLPYVKCYNVSSVALSDFPTEEEVSTFIENTRTNLDMFGGRKVVLGWLRQDIDYVNFCGGAPLAGIEVIKNENNIKYFDMVLIDGSEFTGQAELKMVYGAKYIFLDDINAFKNYSNYHQLLRDSNYQLLEENVSLRNGYALFKKIN